MPDDSVDREAARDRIVRRAEGRRPGSGRVRRGPVFVQARHCLFARLPLRLRRDGYPCGRARRGLRGAGMSRASSSLASLDKSGWLTEM